ncbi:MAG: patatin-like phospholipase family protein [Candidatus Eremiobacteraeota bacterium]|nr:patatin-like phospholipase family protein [Candidatus Eremiobacteraeota bacterium]
MFGGLPGMRRRDAGRKPVRALILGGGGARGAYEAGVVAALIERERFDIVCGTSIGAVNGMFVAQEEPDRMIDVWRTISTRGITQLKPELTVLMMLWEAANGFLRSPFHQKPSHAVSMLRALPQLGSTRLAGLMGLFDNCNVFRVVEEIADFAALRRTFIVGVTNLSNGRADSFAWFPPGAAADELTFHRSENAEPITAANYARAVCASAALPPVYEPVRIVCNDGIERQFADGAFTNNAPIRQAIDAGATEITCVFVAPSRAIGSEQRAESMMDIASVMLDANTERMLELDIKLTHRINEAVVAGRAPGKRYVSLRLIGPSVPLDLPTLGFENQVEVNRLFELGFSDGRTAAAA